MSFEQYVAKVKKLVNNGDIENAEAKESMIQIFIVTGANSQKHTDSVLKQDLVQNWTKFYISTEMKQ